jgi:hypothetical protein
LRYSREDARSTDVYAHEHLVVVVHNVDDGSFERVAHTQRMRKLGSQDHIARQKLNAHN